MTYIDGITLDNLYRQGYSLSNTVKDKNKFIKTFLANSLINYLFDIKDRHNANIMLTK